jgi:hypothetical protein
MYYTIDHIRMKRTAALVFALSMGLLLLVVAALGGFAEASAQAPEMIGILEGNHLVPDHTVIR